MTDGSRRGKGLLASVRGLGRTLIAIAQTRLAILASDLEEQGAYLAKIALFAAITALGLFFATLLAIFFVIAAFWDHRLIATGVLGAAFLVVALWAMANVRHHLADRPKLLSASLAELEKDQRSLSSIDENNP